MEKRLCHRQIHPDHDRTGQDGRIFLSIN